MEPLVNRVFEMQDAAIALSAHPFHVCNCGPVFLEAVSAGLRGEMKRLFSVWKYMGITPL